MALVNEHCLKLPESSVLADMTKKVNAFRVQYPDAEVARLDGSGDGEPLCPAVAEAMRLAVDDLCRRGGSCGGGPVEGAPFLREAVLKGVFAPLGIHLDASEIFINDGAAGDLAGIQELVRWDNTIAVADPASPLYAASNVMIGRAGVMDGGRWSNVVYMSCAPGGGFVPQPPECRADIVYLCCPANPTGAVFTKEELRRWVSYALHNDALIFYDASWADYITTRGVPRSIYEIKGARRVAVEFRSWATVAGMAGLRCGCTVVPGDLAAATLDGRRVALNALWRRRQDIKNGGADYISQRAAEAACAGAGRAQVEAAVSRRMDNARLLRDGLAALGLQVSGGSDAPWLWVRVPGGEGSVRFFERMLYNARVVCTPGVAYGPQGEGYVRLAACAGRGECAAALERMARWMG